MDAILVPKCGQLHPRQPLKRHHPKMRACLGFVNDNRANRVEDLARGLCEKFERGGLRVAGPLIIDYRWLAEQLADIFVTDPQGENNQGKK